VFHHYGHILQVEKLVEFMRAVLEFLEKTLEPLMEDIGQGWADGKIEVRHEHFATACA